MSGFGPLASDPLASPGGLGPADLSDAFASLTTLHGLYQKGLTATWATADTDHADVWPALADALTASGTFAPDVLANLLEALVFNTGLAHDATLFGGVSDNVAFVDTVLAAWNLLLAESIATTDEALGTVNKLEAITDALAATGQATGPLTAQAACIVALALESLLAQGYSVETLDALTLGDTVAGIAAQLATALDAFAASDDGLPSLRVSLITAETFGTADTLASTLAANSALADGLLLYATLNLGDAEYAGWVLNTDAQAASEYRGLALDSLVSFKGRHYGAGPHGLLRFTGADDDGDPIAAWLVSALTDFGTGQFKRVPEAFIGLSADGALVLKVITREPGTGVKTEDWYAVSHVPAAGPGTGRVQIGRGLKSTWWQVALHNVDGADFALDRIQLRPLILDRRT